MSDVVDGMTIARAVLSVLALAVACFAAGYQVGFKHGRYQ